MTVLRSFIAVELPEGVRHVLLRCCDSIRQIDVRWRHDKWVEPENLHITLKFLGDLESDALQGLADVFAEEASGIREFDLVPHEIRAVPNRRDARMLWAAFLDTDGECGLLAAAAERAGLAAGVAPEERPFRPHSTLVRARKAHRVSAEAVEAANALLGGAHSLMSVATATVFSSELTQRGPVYTVVRRVPLQQR